MNRVIHWFQRDLRISDNAALLHAATNQRKLFRSTFFPIGKISTGGRVRTGRNFLCGCLGSFANNLETVGGRLILRAGDPVEELVKLVQETHAEAIFFNRGADPYSIEVQQQFEEVSRKLQIQLFSFKDITIFEPDEVLNHEGRPFRVFSPYAKAWHQREKPSLSPKIRKLRTPTAVSSLPLPTLETWGLQAEAEIVPSGEKSARLRLTNFLHGALSAYRQKRNLPGAQMTSRLSQDLRFGTLSPREVYFKCLEASRSVPVGIRQSINSYVNELVWREFYMQILAHFPSVLERDFNDQFAPCDGTKTRRFSSVGVKVALVFRSSMPGCAN